jgi:RNA polymerase sigma-70 factor (ECF subfamily)
VSDRNPENQREHDDENFVRLFAHNERHLRAFIRSTGLDWNAVDEVVQTVSLVIWRKWSDFDPSTDFMRWARVIARFEILKYRRSLARDRHVFTDDLMELLADASEEQQQGIHSDQHRAALAECLEQLPEKSRQLIAAAYRGDRTIRQLAEDLGKSATALYKTLDRIRTGLQHCIEQRVAD